MNLYVVVQSGVYRHAVVGVFPTLPVACSAGVTAARAEKDDYHSFEVLECVLGIPGEKRVAEVKRIDTRNWVNGRSVLDGTQVITIYEAGVPHE